jgi:hypothetical protein
MVSTMMGRADRRKIGLLGGVVALAMLALPAGATGQEPNEPGPEEQIEDPELRGLHARMLGLHEQMQDLRELMAARRLELLGDEAASAPPHDGRHAMHLRGFGGGREMGMGMQGMQGRGMMMGRRMSGDELTEGGMQGRGMMRRRMMDRGATSESAPRWWPAGMGRRMMRGMMRQDPEDPKGAEGDRGGG